ncbi:MAG: sigma-70 family RNA polymerase sigma factor [Burkholderiales bacterium]
MHRIDPDSELVRLAKQGDAHAFEALVVKYQRRIASHVARYVKRMSDVEDVKQEVFIKAYRGIGSFKGESAFYTWLCRIATNTALSFVTRQSKVVVLQEDIAPTEGGEWLDLSGSDHNDPEWLLRVKQISESVQHAMTRLRPDFARALNLYAVEGKQYKEIALLLQVPIGTVRTRISRARDFIARRLEQGDRPRSRSMM